MEKFLRPERFGVESNAPNAGKEWAHWLRTFGNFLELTLSKEEATDENKLKLMVNYVSHSVYEIINEAKTYHEAVKLLNDVYVKKKNDIFSRHLLATRRQLADETIDQYVQVLRLLSKDCAFKPVTADQNRNEYIRDAFINGLSSAQIRQRLLENETLTLDQAIGQSRALESAQKHSDVFANGSLDCSSLNATYSKDIAAKQHKTPPALAPSPTQQCFFCGNNRHPRAICPARDQTCNYCQKLGHFSKVCMRKTAKGRPTTASMSILASMHNLSKTMITTKLNGIPANTLIDTGSSDSYVSSTFAQRSKWKVYPCQGGVVMATTSLSSQVTGYCLVDLDLAGSFYEDVKLSLLPNLCTDLIIGQDIMKQHSQINIVFGGSKPPLSICCLTAAKVETPSLFANLSPDCKPIATDNMSLITYSIQNFFQYLRSLHLTKYFL